MSHVRCNPEATSLTPPCYHLFWEGALETALQSPFSSISQFAHLQTPLSHCLLATDFI